MNKSITVEVKVERDPKTVWDLWTGPKHVKNWNHASSDWECPSAANDVRAGGRFSFVMAAKDRTMSFDFNGTYTAVVPQESLVYVIEGGRRVSVQFIPSGKGVLVRETFELEGENPEEMQRAGWQAILGNFKEYAETYRG